MKRVIIILSVILLSCQAEPEAIRYGTDGCHTCKMTLMDHKFGAELVTSKGKVYKFDDLNCMTGFINSGYLNDETIRFTLVVDYSQPEKLIPAEEAFYLQSGNVRSPMGSGIAAFETENARERYNIELKGVALSWSEVSTKAK